MKKFNALLHDVTVINFLLVARLALRYRLVSALAVFAIISSVSYFYFSQITIHTKKVYFKIYNQNDGENSQKSLTDIVTDAANSFLTQGEVTAIISNYEFTHSLAEKLVESPHFTKFNFNNPLKKGHRTHAELFEACDSKDCLVKTVQAMTPSFYNLDAEAGTGRFILTVTTRSAITTLNIIKSFKTALEETRLKAAIADYDNQISQTNELIAKSRVDLDAKGGFNKVASGESLDADIAQQNDKIKNLAARLNQETDQFHFQQIRLKESGVAANRNIDDSNKLEYENYIKVIKRIDLLRQNIASINSTSLEARTETDKKILEQLKTELIANEKELKKMKGVKRNIAHDDTFISNQINNQTNFEFDYKVTTAKVKKLNSEYENSKKELEALYEKKALLENELLALKPDLEYLKLMESKLVSLKMLKSALKSDVSFEQFGNEVASFKRNTFSQLLVFCVVLITFLLFIALIVIYLFDDRIFDEYEIAKCCDNLQVIGQAPTFD